MRNVALVLQVQHPLRIRKCGGPIAKAVGTTVVGPVPVAAKEKPALASFEVVEAASRVAEK